MFSLNKLSNYEAYQYKKHLTLTVCFLNLKRENKFIVKKYIKRILLVLVALILGFIYYYITLPAINIHSKGFWAFLLIGLLAISFVIMLANVDNDNLKNKMKYGDKLVLNNTLPKIAFSVTAIVFAIFIIGYILSSPIINAAKYQKILTVEEGDFIEDIDEISYNEIPVLDKESAIRLGSRKMGSIVEYVSQFEVADNYTQINYQEIPARVTPLEYGSMFKWISNMGDGIPAYIRINMTNQEVELVELDQGMKYTESDHFGRNIYRYLRFRYPTYIFGKINFEIDDEGVPHWICPVKDYTIGLFGGETVGRVVVVNAVTGEHNDYEIGEIPQWIDRVFLADLLIEHYDYHGTLKHGFLNSIFSQKDSLQTTAGYNYLALDDDVWVYTGVTSVGGDDSNVGFVLMNQRTQKTKYYPIPGAEEYSAMGSAEGKVQHLGYNATFPLLLNISGEPTYFLALKDAAGLVKSYAMVNVKQYQIVSIGDSILDCEQNYIELLKSSNITSVDTSVLPEASGIIEKISEVVVEGDTHYYIVLKNDDAIYDVLVSDYINIIKYRENDKITFNYIEGKDLNTVLEIK